MNEPMILTIDAGNSRTKWGVFDSDGELHAHGISLNAELGGEAPAAWRACQRAVISNVAGEAIATALAAMLKPVEITCLWVAASATACGVKNGYAHPQQLGTDRWAALVAAWQHHRVACVVVSAGTALTIDALAVDGQYGIFLGGLIVPGFRLMQESLQRNTAGIEESSGSMQNFPTNTGDALHSGALSAMAGAVASMMFKLQRDSGSQPKCILTGGDALVLASALRSFDQIANNISIADNLVLQGLLAIEKESSRSTAE
jgi:type III pantothenate kinase